MLKCLYPNRTSTDIQYSSQQNEDPIIHNNVSIYAQALMKFHESNPVPETSSHKRLKLQFNKKSNSTKRHSSKEIPQTIYNKSETKYVTSIGSRSWGEAKSVTFDNEEEPVTSFQQRLKQFGTLPQGINPTNHQQFSAGYPSSLQQNSNGGRGRGAYAWCGGGRGRERGPGRESYLSKEYSEYRDKTQSTATIETQEDITLSNSEKLENWKDQVSNMMKDLRISIMIEVEELMNENMKEFMKEMVVSIKNNIVDTMKTQTMINKITNLTPMSPPEPITQDSPQPTPQVEELNKLIDDMDIEKSPNKRKAPTPSTEIENQDDSNEITEDTAESVMKNKERATARKSRLNKT